MLGWHKVRFCIICETNRGPSRLAPSRILVHMYFPVKPYKPQAYHSGEWCLVRLSYQWPSGWIFPRKHHVIGRSMHPSR